MPPRSASVEWFRCPSCDGFIYHKRLRRNLGVCPECNHHFRLGVRERLGQLLDEASFEELSGDLEPVDVLSFTDTKPYPERIAQAQGRSETRAGALYGRGTIDAHPVVVAALDFSFIGGSMGGAAGEAITRAAELALETRTPLLAISASGGARMQEGCVSLMQMVKTSQSIARLGEEGVLYLSLLTDPTYGGVSASYATLGDILISEPGAHIGFAGAAVIEQTIREQLPDGFQTAGFLLDHGMLDVVEPRENLRRLLAQHPRAPCARRDRPPRGRRRARSSGCRAPTDVRRPRRPAGAGPRSLGCRPARPQDRAPADPRLHRVRVRLVRGAARRSDVQGGRGDRRRARVARRPQRRRDRTPEGAHDERDDGSELRDAGARGLPQGDAADALRGALRDADRDARRHARRLPRDRRRGARPIERDRGVDHADVAAAGPDRERGHRRGRKRRRAGARGGRPGADDGERLLLRDQPGGVCDDPLQGCERSSESGRHAAHHRA